MFKEIIKALKILMTIPMTNLETGQCFSNLKLIGSNLRNTLSEFTHFEFTLIGN